MWPSLFKLTLRQATKFRFLGERFLRVPLLDGPRGATCAPRALRSLTLVELEELVTGARLVATLIADPQAKDDVDGQKTMMDTHSDHIEGLVSECNGFGSRPDHFSFRLSFHGDVVELTEIGKFAYKEGKVELKRTGNAEPAGEGDHGGDPQD